MITFSGVDGAGKTTILRNFSDELRNQYGLSLVEIRHRPSILPILSTLKYGDRERAEQKTTEVPPRTGKNRSKLSSYLRFFYYLADYIFGQWVLYLRYTRKGVIIVYDRYFFDFIVDGRRSNIDVSSRFVEFFYRFVIKPEINVFLYAKPDVILARKTELDSETISRLTEGYLDLFHRLNMKQRGEYLAIENLSQFETVRKIRDIFWTRN